MRPLQVRAEQFICRGGINAALGRVYRVNQGRINAAPTVRSERFVCRGAINAALGRVYRVNQGRINAAPTYNKTVGAALMPPWVGYTA